MTESFANMLLDELRPMLADLAIIEDGVHALAAEIAATRQQMDANLTLQQVHREIAAVAVRIERIECRLDPLGSRTVESGERN